jgi:hypothetical protein
MVRLKNRYLLVDILYPDPSTWPSIKTTDPQSTQLSIHSPTSDALTPGLLAKMVREEVGEMYGDWGVGKLGGASATGINSTRSYSTPLNQSLTHHSKIPLPSNINRHNPLSPSGFPSRVVGTHIHDPCPGCGRRCWTWTPTAEWGSREALCVPCAARVWDDAQG